MKKYRGSIIAQQIIDDRKREQREKERVLKAKKLYELYKEKRGDSSGGKTKKRKRAT